MYPLFLDFSEFLYGPSLMKLKTPKLEKHRCRFFFKKFKIFYHYNISNLKIISFVFFCVEMYRHGVVMSNHVDEQAQSHRSIRRNLNSTYDSGFRSNQRHFNAEDRNQLLLEAELRLAQREIKGGFNLHWQKPIINSRILRREIKRLSVSSRS